MASRKGAAAGQVREPRARYAALPAVQRAAEDPPPPRRALLDVNVLIALLDADHIHHARAAGWLADNIAGGWASCAITQNGCVRIMAQPGYPNALPAAGVARRLREATETAHHRFIPGDLSLLDPAHFDVEQLLGHAQVTDAYLLGLAVAHRLRFVSFDAKLSLRVAHAARPGDLVVL